MIPLSQTLMLSFYPKEEKSYGSRYMVYDNCSCSCSRTCNRWLDNRFILLEMVFLYGTVPFGILSTYIVHSIFRKKGYKDKIEKVPVDKWGLIFLAIGISALQIMLDKGNDLDWFQSPFIISLALIAFIFFDYISYLEVVSPYSSSKC